MPSVQIGKTLNPRKFFNPFQVSWMSCINKVEVVLLLIFFTHYYMYTDGYKALYTQYFSESCEQISQV